MNSHSKPLTPGIAAAVALCFLSPSGTAIAQEDTPEPQAFDGEWRYYASCAGCHGEGGEGIYAFGPAMKGNAFVRNAPAAAIVRIIQEGRNYENRAYIAYVGMPAFPYLRAGEAEALVQYMKGPMQE